MTTRPGRNGFDTVRFLVEHGPWGLLGFALGGFIGLALGGAGESQPSVNGVVAATEWSDYVHHSWIPMLVCGLVGAVVLAAVASYVKRKRGAR